MEHVDRNAPFRLIQCPLCDGTDFVTVGFTGVWCDRCQAEFHVRHTAGDPGFVVDCTWRHYQPTAARYLLPRSDELVLTMVCKNGGGDPLDLTHDRHCYRDDCTDAQVALTDGRDSSLRAGLHACVIGDVYDWSFYGQVPNSLLAFIAQTFSSAGLAVEGVWHHYQPVISNGTTRRWEL